MEDPIGSDCAMIALVPNAESASLCSVAGGLPSEVLHVTLAFLGKAEYLDTEDEYWALAICEELSELYSRCGANLWAVSSLNPTVEQASVYLVSGDEYPLAELAELTQELCVEHLPLFPTQHSPWVAHMTIGYNVPTSLLLRAGTTVTYDRIRLAIGTSTYDFPLQSTESTMTKYDEINNLLSSVEMSLVAYNRGDVDYTRDGKGEFDTPPSGHYKSGSTKADTVKSDKNDKIKLYIETKSQKADRQRRSLDKHQGRSINRTGHI